MHVDYLIIGAGPAGLQLGYYLEKNKRDYLILERWYKPGKFFDVFPRHRFLISINKVHTGKDNPEVKLRYDWNSLLSDSDELRFTKYSEDYFPHPDLLVKYLEDYANYYKLRIQYNTTVTTVSKPDSDFLVSDAEGNTYTSKRLVVATGFTKLYEPDFPGWELCDTYFNQSVDPQDYVNQRVLIVGKGNTAFETAENLTVAAAVIHVLSPHSVKMAWQTHYVGNLRAINNNFLDTYQLKSQNTVIDAALCESRR
jgi:cation diffusion facilitator CzcD-associated flavoprotein CzcO